MPRYFFDTDDGRRAIQDDFGIDAASAEELETMTRDLLFDRGHIETMAGLHRGFTVVVRDDQGAMIYRGTLNLGVDLGPPMVASE